MQPDRINICPKCFDIDFENLDYADPEENLSESWTVYLSTEQIGQIEIYYKCSCSKCGFNRTMRIVRNLLDENFKQWDEIGG